MPFLPRVTTRFEPVVRLADRRPIGYEALARFRDGRSPDQAFAAARQDGAAALTRLEIDCLRAAIRNVEQLPRGAFLGLNLSARAILAAESEIARQLRTTAVPLVLELVEWDMDPAVVHPLGRLRREFGARLRLALDDYAPQHGPDLLATLTPELVKTDRTLLWAAMSDSAPRVLLRELVVATHARGALLVVEGIEDLLCESLALRFGATLGQGYLYPSLGVESAKPRASARATTKPSGKASRPESGRIRAR